MLPNLDLDLNHGQTKVTEKKAALVPASDYNLSGHPDDYVLRIDNSTLEKFQTCPRSAFYYVIHRRTPNPSEALIAGGALHNGLEYLYTHGLTTSNLPNACAEVDKHFALNPSQYTWRNPHLVYKALEQYVSKYEGNDPFEIVEYEGKPFVERSFELELGSVELNRELAWSQKYLCGEGEDTPLHVRKLFIVWIGKVDMLIRDMLGLRVLDHKTSSIMGDTFWRNFELSQQTLGYTWAAGKIFGETPKGFMANVIYWRPPRKNENMGRVEFHRQQYQYSEERIAEWEADIYASCVDFVQSMVRNHFPGYRTWCSGKYGMCAYHDVCTVDNPKMRMAMLETGLYSNVDWDPTKK